MSILTKLQSLLTAANAKTGESDTTLTDAVQTLVDGYGQGGGGNVQFASGTYTPSSNVANFSVSIDFEPKYGIVFIDPLELEKTSAWKDTVRTFFPDEGFAASSTSRWLNDGATFNSSGAVNLTLNSGNYGAPKFEYVNGILTMGNGSGAEVFLAGETYTWFVWREST